MTTNPTAAGTFHGGDGSSGAMNRANGTGITHNCHPLLTLARILAVIIGALLLTTVSATAQTFTIMSGPTYTANADAGQMLNLSVTVELLRNGAPYLVKGGGGGENALESLAKAGGNSIRLWGDRALLSKPAKSKHSTASAWAC